MAATHAQTLTLADRFYSHNNQVHALEGHPIREGVYAWCCLRRMSSRDRGPLGSILPTVNSHACTSNNHSTHHLSEETSQPVDQRQYRLPTDTTASDIMR